MHAKCPRPNSLLNPSKRPIHYSQVVPTEPWALGLPGVPSKAAGTTGARPKAPNTLTRQTSGLSGGCNLVEIS